MKQRKRDAPELSVVIPILDEAENIEELYASLKNALADLPEASEVIFVDDGSRDGSREVLERIHGKEDDITVVVLRRHFGKAEALRAGFERARGKIIVTLDGDLQDDPREIRKFLDKIREEYDVVSGWRKRRRDSFRKLLPSKVYNFLLRKLSGLPLHDFNCGFKAFRSEVLVEIDLYGENHRYILMIAHFKGFRVGEVVVEHQPRKRGRSKFGAERYLRGFLDLLSLLFLTRFKKRPAHFFGGLGLAGFFAGFCICLYITWLRITLGHIQNRHPLLLLGILLLLLGIQLILTGFLAELVTHFAAPAAKMYSVKTVLKGDCREGKGKETGPD
jgi:glycosyltransferase involved in cell wall biosynthesis